MADIAHREIDGAREFRVSAYLKAAAAHLPEALLPATTLQPIFKLCDELPGAATSFFGFECRLNDPAASADFLFCATREEGHARILAGARADIDIPPALLSHPAWQRLRSFCQEWERIDSRLQQQIMNIWLEFDIATNPRALTCPSLFFGMHPPPNESNRVDSAEALCQTLALLEPAAAYGPRGAALRRLCAGLPDSGYAFQIGVMFARQVSASRVCLRGLAPAAIGALLETQEWPGARGEVDELVATLAPLCDRLDVDLDVGDALAAKIGIECYFGTDAQTIERILRFGDYLIAHDMCTPAKLEALARYNGLTHEDSNPAGWPQYLHALAVAEGPGIASCLVRWLHHIKVVLEPGKPLLAKAYLAVEHHAIDRRRLASAIDAARTSARP